MPALISVNPCYANTNWIVSQDTVGKQRTNENNITATLMRGKPICCWETRTEVVLFFLPSEC